MAAALPTFSCRGSPLNGSAGVGFQSTYAGGSGKTKWAASPTTRVPTRSSSSAPRAAISRRKTPHPRAAWFDDTFGGGLDIIVATYSSNLATKEFASYIGGNANDYMGATGDLIGRGHLAYSDVTGLSYVGTTIHSDDRLSTRA